MLREWMRRLWMLARRRELERDLDDELTFHTEMRERAHAEAGLTPDEAARQARLDLGNRTLVREDARDAWIGQQWRTVRQDLALGWRGLWRTPTVAFSLIGTLALGVGANVAIFSVIDSVLLRPLPYAEPHRLVLLWATSPNTPLDTLTPGSFYDFRQRLTGVTSLAGISNIPVVMTGRGPAARVPAMSTSIDFFEILGVHAAFGRTFDRRDGVAPRVAVLSHRFWMREFGGQPDAVGQSLTLRGIPYTIVGVMDDAFVMPSIATQSSSGSGPELWIPGDAHEIPRGVREDAADQRENRQAGYVRAIGRLRPGVDAAGLQAEATVIAQDLERRFPDRNAGAGAAVVPFDAHLLERARTPILIVSVAVAAVLLTACANIAGILLGRGAARQREMATRVALGASRARLVRQLLTENVVLALAAGGAGLLVGTAVLGWLTAMAPSTVLRLEQARMDGRSMAFGLALSFVTTMAFGALPALQTSRVMPQGVLAMAAGRMTEDRSRLRMRRFLVAGEIALAYVLLVSALLVGRSLLTLVRTDVGYDARQILAFEMALAGPSAASPDSQRLVYGEILSGLRALPGVTAAAAVVNLPVGGDDFGAPVAPDVGPVITPGDEPRADYQIVSPAYFDALRIPLHEGRDFTDADSSAGERVVIVNQSLARRFWPDRKAVGHRLRIGSGNSSWLTVIGVVGDVRHGGPASAPAIGVYLPYTQRSFPFMSFVVRTSRDPMTLESAVRALVADAAPGVPVAGASTLEARLGASVADTRFLTVLLVSFAAVAGLLAFVGVYGVVALAAIGRQREMGIRLALGATRRQAAGPVVRSGLAIAAAGLVAGLLASWGAGQLATSLLAGVPAPDGATFVAAMATVAAAALVAILVPVRRSTSIPPATVLRAE